MGCWGLGSDENDWTWDDVGLGIMERASGFELNARGRSADGLVKNLVEDSGPEVLNRIGVVMFLLKQGCPVPLDNLTTTRKELVEEDHKKIFPEKPEERKLIVSDEIAIIDAAMENNGVVPGPPIGVRPITFSGAVPMPFNLRFRISDLERLENERRSQPQAGHMSRARPRKKKQSADATRKEEHEILIPDETKCANCGRTADNLLRCSRCSAICYCNRDCQLAHYKVHKKPCKNYAAAMAAGIAAVQEMVDNEKNAAK